MSAADSKEFLAGNKSYVDAEIVARMPVRTSDEKNIQMQKGDLTRELRVSAYPNRGLAPKEFTYWRCENNLFGKYIYSLCPELVVCTDGTNSYPLSGYLTIRWCTVWVPQKGCGLWFKSKDEYDKLYKELSTEYNQKFKTIPNKVYRLNSYCQWNLSSTYLDQSKFKLVGYEGYMTKIEHDINNHKIHAQILLELGETKSLNYLLYGPPGVGKTTLVRALASKYNYPVCIVNPNIIKPECLDSVLNPKINSGTNDGIIFVVFEDFDRFIENTNNNEEKGKENKNNVMSQILNSLDGFCDSSNVVRFFTGNDYNKIENNEALLNRMSYKFQFGYPPIEFFVEKFKMLLKVKKLNEINEEKNDVFFSLIKTKENLTLRPFTNYVLRYLFCDDYMDKLIENVNELD